MFAPRAPFSLNSPLAQMPPPNPPTSLECPTFMHAESHWLPLSKSTLYLPLIQPSPVPIRPVFFLFWWSVSLWRHFLCHSLSTIDGDVLWTTRTAPQVVCWAEIFFRQTATLVCWGSRRSSICKLPSSAIKQKMALFRPSTGASR